MDAIRPLIVKTCLSATCLRLARAVGTQLGRREEARMPVGGSEGESDSCLRGMDRGREAQTLKVRLNILTPVVHLRHVWPLSLSGRTAGRRTQAYPRAGDP